VRIAQIAPLYESVPPRQYGGTERVVSYLTEELVRLGHDVTLFASGDSVTSARLVPACAQSLRLTSGVVDTLAHHVRLLDLVRRESDRFDVLHFHIDYLHFPLSRCHDWTAVTTLHGRLDLPDLQPLYDDFCDMPVVSISDAQRRPLPQARWVGTVYHGLPPERYRFQPASGRYLAFLGRVSPEKRVDRAIEIARRAGLPLKIAAKIDTADQAYFDREIAGLFEAPFVEYLGEISDADKSDFLGGAAALLFPIDWCEPFGLVMIEAMACGTPVIAWPGGAVGEILDDPRSGFVVESIDEAVDAVQRARRLDRRGCREVFEGRFTAARMTAEYLTLYARLVAEGVRREPDHERAH
jgi:glycosyltransferase involved in cell wall biosynthesis